MGTLEHAVCIQAPPDAVWSVYVDPSRIPDWQTGSPVIEDVRGSGGAPGSTYISRRGPGAATTTTTNVGGAGVGGQGTGGTGGVAGEQNVERCFSTAAECPSPEEAPLKARPPAGLLRLRCQIAAWEFPHFTD